MQKKPRQAKNKCMQTQVTKAVAACQNARTESILFFMQHKYDACVTCIVSVVCVAPLVLHSLCCLHCMHCLRLNGNQAYKSD